jgi:hypothetical protein
MNGQEKSKSTCNCSSNAVQPIAGGREEYIGSLYPASQVLASMVDSSAPSSSLELVPVSVGTPARRIYFQTERQCRCFSIIEVEEHCHILCG